MSSPPADPRDVRYPIENEQLPSQVPPGLGTGPGPAPVYGHVRSQSSVSPPTTVRKTPLSPTETVSK